MAKRDYEEKVNIKKPKNPQPPTRKKRRKKPNEPDGGGKVNQGYIPHPREKKPPKAPYKPMSSEQRKMRDRVYSARYNLKQRVKDMEKRGYIFPDYLKEEIEEMYRLPGRSIPQMRSYLESIKDYRFRNLIEEVDYQSELSYNERISGVEGYAIERRIRQRDLTEERLSVIMSLIDLIDELAATGIRNGYTPEAIQAKIILQREYSAKNPVVLLSAQRNADALNEAVYALYASEQEYRTRSLSDVVNLLFSGSAMEYKEVYDLNYDYGV